MNTLLARSRPSTVSHTYPATVERRFVPAAIFDADMGRTPCDDSCVVPVGLSDRAELNEWIDSHDTPPTDIDFDEMFGASLLNRESPIVSLKTWPDSLLVELVGMCVTARDESLLDVATTELLIRVRPSAA